MTQGFQTTKLNEVAFLSNTIIRSPLYLNNTEARLFALALACLHQKEDSLAFSIHFNDITGQYLNETKSRNGGSQYAILHEARARLTQPLINHSMTRDNHGKRRSDAIPLFSIITLDEGSSLVTGQFNPILKEYLLGLAGKFTTVELVVLLRLKSAHTQRLFWILRSFHEQPWPKPISFEELREWLFGENSELYTLWTDFNRHVLKPALEEFKAIGWEVEVTVTKRGRRMDSLLFKMINTQQVDEKSHAVKSKKALTLSEITEFRDMLAATYSELPRLYDSLRLDFELKEYQAREVVNTIANFSGYGLVTNVLQEVRVALINAHNIKSVAAYTLSQLKAVLPVYQPLAGPADDEKLPAAGSKQKLPQRKSDKQKHLTSAEPDTPSIPLPNEGKSAQLAFQLSPSGLQTKVTPTQKRAIQKLESELDDVKTSLRFVRDEAPETLYSPEERAAKVQELTTLVNRIREQLGK